MPGVAFIPDSSKLLAVKMTDKWGRGEPAIFDAATGQYEGAVDKLLLGVPQASADGVLFLGGSYISFYDPRQAKPLTKFVDRLPPTNEKNKQLKHVQMANDKRLLAAAFFKRYNRESYASELIVENYDKNERISVFRTTATSFEKVAIAPDGKQIAVGTWAYEGIRGQKDGPRWGHVLLFNIAGR